MKLKLKQLDLPVIVVGLLTAVGGWLTFSATILPTLTALALILTWLLIRARSSGMKALWLNLLVVSLVIMGGEGYFYWKKDPTVTTTWSNHQYITSDPAMGYRPASGAIRRTLVTREDKTVYDAVYQFDANGMRVTPPARSDKKWSVIFFGCSYTLGEGLNNDQVFPFLVGRDSGLKSYNLGFHGYGTHQMLAALSGKRLDEAVKEPTVKVVYLALTCHLWRAAGKTPWNYRDPEYQMGTDGKPVFMGMFNRPRPENLERRWRNLAYDQCNRSALFRHLYSRWAPRIMSRTDFQRFAALTAASRDLVKKKFPAADFEVILWTEYESENAKLGGMLREKGIKLTLIDEILPGFRADESKYRIDGDGHPNALSHRLIAAHILKTMVIPAAADNHKK